MGVGKFCYICGATDVELHEGLCRSCYPKEKDLINIPGKFEANICRGCDRIYRARWEEGEADPESTIRAIAREEVERSFKGELKDKEINVRVLGVENNGKVISADLAVYVKVNLPGFDHTYTLYSTLELRQSLCPDCSKRAGGYYEALIQIRTDRIDELLAEARTIVNKIYQKDKMAFIVDASRVKGGLDLKLGSAKAARALATHFKNKYGAKIKDSATLIGRREGKNVFRKTILIRI
jgi:nonsense-mediated mRNA decay protein 3